MKPIISVIVPAYNAESTIERCLKSILTQTYQNLEVLVINDGSTDNTEKKILKICNDDERVKLFSIRNSGVSHARNLGIDNAKGDYITFVDSDDFIEKEMYQILLGLIENYNVKIAHCSYQNTDENGKLISVVGGKNRTIRQNHDEAMICLLEGKYFSGGLWNKLYHSSLFSQCRLDETIKYSEDILLNYQLFDQVEASVYIDSPLYNYVAVQNSSTHSANNFETRTQWLFVSKRILELAKGKSYQKIAEDKVAHSLLGMYREYIVDSKKRNYPEKKQIQGEIDFYRNKGFLSSKKDKVEYFIYRYFPWLFNPAYAVFDKIRVKRLDPEQ